MNPKPPPRVILPKAEPGSSESPTLDSIPSGGDAPAKRRCISSACMPCRRRKSKCDGGQPACNACTSVYGSQCYYDIDSDHRRKGALKRDIAQLKEELSSQNVILDAIKRGTEADVDDIIQLVRAHPEESYDFIAENIQRMSISANKKEPGGLEGELANFSVKPGLEKTGETLHYGHTSNLAMLGVDDDHAALAGDQIGTWTSVTNDAEFIHHLFDVYFAWSHPFYLMFSEEVFFHGLRGKKLKYCTPLLVNAILAVACHFSDRPEARSDPIDPSTVGNHFFAEAKRLLHEDDRSCLTTVQALGVMSIHSAMNNQDSSGWQYESQMMSMAIQLGLHTSYAAQPSGMVTASEIEARRVTFWGCFVVQTAWSICVGRISALPRNAIRLEKPCLRDHLEGKVWRPYGDANLDGVSPGLEQASLKYTTLLYVSTLSEIVDDVVHMFYAPRDRITSRKLLQHHEKFQTWYKNLPDVLRIRETGPTLPQVLSLHIYYHNCVLHLFRPFLKVSFVQNSKPPRQICTEQAEQISQLTRRYTQSYGMRRYLFICTHCLVSAAIIHIVNISGSNTPSAASEKAEIYLAEAIRGLHTTLETYPIVDRFMRAIQTLVHKWCTVIPDRVKGALAEVEISSPTTASDSIASPNNHIELNIDQNMTNDASMHHNYPPQVNPGDRKPSAPELLGMAPNQHDTNGNNMGPSTPSYQQQLFWTPFPEHVEGLPLEIPVENNMNQLMDITSMLDSGVDGDWPQLNRDGFTMGPPGEEDGGQALRGVSWDGNM